MLFNKESLIGDQFFLDDHIEDDVILDVKGNVLAMFEVTPVHPDTADITDLVSCFDQLHGMIKNMAHDDIEFIVYQCHGTARSDCYRDGPHTADFVQELSQAYRENLLRMTLYENRYYLAVSVCAPGQTKQSLVAFFGDLTADPRAEIKRRAERLNNICVVIQSTLTRFSPRRLGIVKRGHALCSEIVEAIVLAMTGKWRQIALTTGRISHNMFSESLRLTPSYHPTRIEFHGPGNPRYAEIYACKDPPTITVPGQFDDLMKAGYTCTFMQSFRALSTTAAQPVLTRKQNVMVLSGDKAYGQIAELALAPNQLFNREWVLGDHSMLFIVFGDTKNAIHDVSNAGFRDLGHCGVVAQRVTKALRAAFQSLAPGNSDCRPRPAFTKSSNFLAFTPFYGWPTGPLEGMWGGPIATFRSMGGTPLYFHWQRAGNTLITGKPDAGKTLLTAFLLGMTAGRARIVALDHKRGWKFLIEHLHGDYAVWGAGEPHCAPLKALKGTARDIEFLTLLFRGCIAGDMTEEEGRRLVLGLRSVLRLPPEDRSISELRGFFDSTPEGAGKRLEKWILGGELGWVLDAPVDTVNFGQLSGIDLTSLLNNPRVRGPSMSYLFHRIEAMLDGSSPFLLPIDEGWKALKDEIFRENIENQIRTIRSKGGVVVFITQSPDELIESKIARVLIGMCPTRFHMADPGGSHADYVKELKLTEGQYEALMAIDPRQGKFLLVQERDAIVGQLPLHNLPQFTAVLSANEASLQQADKRALEAATKEQVP